MLSPRHVLAALEAKRAAFEGYELRIGQTLERYRQALTWFAQQDHASLLARLAGSPTPGARPTKERAVGQPFIRPFGLGWENHAQARAWAMEILHGVTTAAVDGSQITPSADFSIPVGAVQVGWFINPHRQEADYIKDLAFEVLAPAELQPGQEMAERDFPDLQVNLRRFERECAQLGRLMERFQQEGAKALCFFDGSLVISFAGHMRPELRTRYIDAIVSLLEASEHTRIPLVGYIDTSHASDLTAMLDHLLGHTPLARPSDAALLRRQMAWGDRSEALQCARQDLVFEESIRPSYYGRVHFVYLKTTSENAPARLDLPAWILEEGLLDWVLDVVRAECVVGTGYPYALETADAVAVITTQDRERFYRLCQEFLAQSQIPLRYSRKAYSKRSRR